MDITLNRTTQNPITELRMKASELHRLGGARADVVITCNKGSLWVTQSGDAKDYFLQAGDQFHGDKNTVVVIEAIDDADVRIARN